MKRDLLLITLFICLFITGCGVSKTEQDTFQHYNLKGKDVNRYVYHSDERGKEIYALADDTIGSMTITTGFYYKIDDDDYILLEKFESSKANAYKSQSAYRFYNNKLYGVGNGDTPMYFEIELKGKESHIEEKRFDYNGKLVGPADIKEIENGYITFYGYTSLENEAMAGRNFKCSLENYKCEIMES